MHITIIKLNNGMEITGFIDKYRPQDGWMSLMKGACIRDKENVSFDSDKPYMIYFKDMISAVTKDERLSINHIGDQDEIARAKYDLAQGRMYGWEGYPLEKFEWEN